MSANPACRLFDLIAWPSARSFRFIFKRRGNLTIVLVPPPAFSRKPQAKPCGRKQNGSWKFWITLNPDNLCSYAFQLETPCAWPSGAGSDPDLVPDRLHVGVEQGDFADFIRVADLLRRLKPIQCQVEIAELAGIAGEIVRDGLVLRELPTH